MLKIGSDEWLQVELKSRKIRDDNRKKFFAKYGKPITKLEEINIPPTNRIVNIQKLYALTGDKLNSSDLDAMREHVMPLLLSHSPGSLETVTNMFCELYTQSPTNLKSFFLTDFIPTYDFTKVDK